MVNIGKTNRHHHPPVTPQLTVTPVPELVHSVEDKLPTTQLSSSTRQTAKHAIIHAYHGAYLAVTVSLSHLLDSSSMSLAVNISTFAILPHLEHLLLTFLQFGQGLDSACWAPKAQHPHWMYSFHNLWCQTQHSAYRCILQLGIVSSASLKVLLLEQ